MPYRQYKVNADDDVIRFKTGGADVMRFIGFRAGEDNTTRTQNIALGDQAMRENTSGLTNIISMVTLN